MTKLGTPIGAGPKGAIVVVGLASVGVPPLQYCEPPLSVVVCSCTPPVALGAVTPAAGIAAPAAADVADALVAVRIGVAAVDRRAGFEVACAVGPPPASWVALRRCCLVVASAAGAGSSLRSVGEAQSASSQSTSAVAVVVDFVRAGGRGRGRRGESRRERSRRYRGRRRLRAARRRQSRRRAP